MKTVSIIRQRGQLTIPESIRRAIHWIAPMSAVSVSLTKPDEIVIRPHYAEKKVDWDKLWTQIKRVRAFEGKSRGSLSGFIVEDREARR